MVSSFSPFKLLCGRIVYSIGAEGIHHPLPDPAEFRLVQPAGGKAAASHPAGGGYNPAGI